ncbi:unnamed protein product [Brugia timori]|uniref:Uncharacterized protein n=1 Tax=Brugia timori TaxID=42155 RepID=A0A0R3QRM2_9BILA|nr:unnamed protein product [Brugia timori]
MNIQSPDPILPNHEELQTNKTKDRFIDEKILRLQMYINSIEALNKPPITESTKLTSYRSQLHFRWRTRWKNINLPQLSLSTSDGEPRQWREFWNGFKCIFPGYPVNPKNELFNFLLKRMLGENSKHYSI